MSALPPWTAVRLSAFYAAIFTAIGILIPFWPVWLESRGLAAEQIAVVLAAGIGAKVVGNPIIAHVADRLGERRRPIVALAVAATIAFALFAGVSGFAAILAVSVAFFLVWPAIMPLVESLTMLAVREGGHDYGRIRLWGSLAFIAAAVGAGRILEGRPPDILYQLILAAVATTAVVGLLLPAARPPVSERGHLPVLQVLRRPGFALFLASATAVQASHAAYYAFATLHWRAAGYDDELIGALWAEGVIAEIALFAYGDRVVRAFGPAGLILLGGAAGAVRWTATGLTSALPVLAIVQALHALSFGAAHLGAIHYIARTVPVEMSASAQSLYAAVVMGLGLGLMLLAAGPLYADVGAGAFYAMAACAAVGAVLAVRLARYERGRSIGGSSLGA